MNTRHWSLRLAVAAGVALLVAASTTPASARDRDDRTHREQERRSVVIYQPVYDPYWTAGPWWYEPAPRVYRAPIPSDMSALEVHSNHGKASVTVDGNLVGQARDFDTSDHPIWVRPGTHVLRLNRDGYQPVVSTVEVRGGQMVKLHITLEKVKH